MGEEIARVKFTEKDFVDFRASLRKETAQLMQWFKLGKLCENEQLELGLEVEAWLTDEDGLPSPKNQEFIDHCDHKLIVPELSKFNIELNSNPFVLDGLVFSKLEKHLQSVLHVATNKANDLNLDIVMIGSLPTLRDHMLTMDYMSDMARYKSMNNSIMKMREGKSIHLDIEGKDHLHVEHKDIMLEAAATSLQIHLKTPQSNSKEYYNACVVASSAMVALAANSPFVFGHDLWEESRVPIFEQGVKVLAFPTQYGDMQTRVTLGHKFCKESIFEFFLENLNSYDVLLPMLKEGADDLPHLRLHNGNIWRWNRPILGENADGTPHVRIEHRAPSAGPTVKDMIANMAFFVGLVHFIVGQEEALGSMEFEDCKTNFYNAARLGFGAQVKWFHYQNVNLQTLLANDLVSWAKQGLRGLKVNEEEIEYYIDNIIYNRVQSGRTGAHWQRAWVNHHGSCFQDLTKEYLHRQQSNEPVHTWVV